MKQWKSISVLMLCFTTLLFFTSCQSDSSSEEEAEKEKVEETTPEVAESTEKPLTPQDIARQKIEGLPTTSVEWEKVEHDFGDITKGEKVSTTFKFKNTGDAPLIIADAKAGCGCTVPKKPEEPIQPGETGEISVEYNGSGNGKVTKSVNVILNTESQNEKLTIMTNVLAAEE